MNVPRPVTAQQPAEAACDGLPVSVGLSGAKPCIKPGLGGELQGLPRLPGNGGSPGGELPDGLDASGGRS